MLKVGYKVIFLLLFSTSFIKKLDFVSNKENDNETMLVKIVEKYFDAVNKRDASLLSETIDCNLYSRNNFNLNLSDSIIINCSDFISVQEKFWRIGRDIYENKKVRRIKDSTDNNSDSDNHFFVIEETKILMNKSKDKAFISVNSSKVLKLYFEDFKWFIYDCLDYNGTNFVVPD